MSSSSVNISTKDTGFSHARNVMDPNGNWAVIHTPPADESQSTELALLKRGDGLSQIFLSDGYPCDCSSEELSGSRFTKIQVRQLSNQNFSLTINGQINGAIFVVGGDESFSFYSSEEVSQEKEFNFERALIIVCSKGWTSLVSPSDQTSFIEKTSKELGTPSDHLEPLTAVQVSKSLLQMAQTAENKEKEYTCITISVQQAPPLQLPTAYSSTSATTNQTASSSSAAAELKQEERRQNLINAHRVAIIRTQHNLGIAMMEKKQYESAEIYLQNACMDLENLLNEAPSLDLVKILVSFGENNYLMGKLPEAIEALSLGLEETEELPPEISAPLIATLSALLAKCYASTIN